MCSLGGVCTTYRYDSHDDPVEETVEHRSREASFDEIGNVHYSSDRVNLQHNRLEYRYDDHGNWTERIVSFRSESEPRLSALQHKTQNDNLLFKLAESQVPSVEPRCETRLSASREMTKTRHLKGKA